MTNIQNLLEENLREAASINDIKAVKGLLIQNVDVNAQHKLNGWQVKSMFSQLFMDLSFIPNYRTPLHWATKRGNDEIVQLLLTHGADPKIQTFEGQTSLDLCTKQNIATLFNDYLSPEILIGTTTEINSSGFIANYLRNPVLNAQVELNTKRKAIHDVSYLPTTNLPAQTDELVLKARVAGSSDPDFIEIELSRRNLNYSALIKLCCDELEISQHQIERIRKLPNTRLRNDKDVKRLTAMQCLEIVLKTPIAGDKLLNAYQSISSCRDQTILY